MKIKDLKNTPESISEFCADVFNKQKSLGKPYDDNFKKMYRKFVESAAQTIEDLKKLGIDL